MKVAAKIRQKLKVKEKTQAAAAPKQTRQQVSQKVKKALPSSYYKKKVRSLNSSERFEELTQEVEGCRWDAFLISETWRVEQRRDFWETQQGHIHGLRKIR